MPRPSTRESPTRRDGRHRSGREAKTVYMPSRTSALSLLVLTALPAGSSQATTPPFSEALAGSRLRALQAGLCLAYCPKDTHPWPNKCFWEGCSGCTPYCLPPAAGDEEPTSVGCSIPVSAGKPRGQPSYCADEPDLFNGFEPARGCLTLCDETPSCAYVSLWANGWCRLTQTCSEPRRTGNSMAVTVTCAPPRQLSPPSLPLPPPPLAPAPMPPQLPLPLTPPPPPPPPSIPPPLPSTPPSTPPSGDLPAIPSPSPPPTLAGPPPPAPTPASTLAPAPTPTPAPDASPAGSCTLAYEGNLYCADEPKLFAGQEPLSQCQYQCQRDEECAFVSSWGSGWCRLSKRCDKRFRSSTGSVRVYSCGSAGPAPSPSPPTVCKSFCEDKTQAWDDTCNWRGCNGCTWCTIDLGSRTVYSGV